ASAVPVALTLSGLLLQIREKKVGSPERCTLTVTVGFTPKAARSDEQFVLDSPPAEYCTVTVGAKPPTVFCVATALAASLAGLVGPPQILNHCDELLFGSPVMPVRERMRAAVRAAVSADRCASALAR